MSRRCVREIGRHIYQSNRNLQTAVVSNGSAKLNFIDGERLAPTGSTAFEIINPATGNSFAECANSSLADVDKVVASAKRAFLLWSNLSGLQRSNVLRKAGVIIQERLEEIARKEVEDNGKPIYEARMDISGCADVFLYYAGIASTMTGQHIPLQNNNFALVLREPLGVVAGIGAWNYPFQTATWKLAPALACGNTFIYKPSPLTPTTAVMLAEILTEAGAPEGSVGIIQGGAEVGQAISHHTDIAKVSFTGSVPTGQRIMQACAKDGLRHVTLELGGKSPLIIFEDADLNNAVKGAMLANFLTQGEVCSNAARVFVHRSIMDEFSRRVIERVKGMQIGDPLDESTTVGATISEEHMNKVLAYIQTAKKEGATIACGGERVVPDASRVQNGYFLSPCVITDVTDGMTVAKEEIFGSVMCLMPFDDEEEVIHRANDTPYGLAAGIFTKNLSRAHRVVRQLQAGTLYVNNYNVVSPEIPFGGYKMSGFGRELGHASVESYTQVKSVYFEMGDVDSPI